MIRFIRSPGSRVPDKQPDSKRGRTGTIRRNLELILTRLAGRPYWLVVGILATGAVVLFLPHENESPGSTLYRVPSLDSTPSGAWQSQSAYYRETLEQANSMNAEEASNVGQSFIAVPESIPRAVNPAPERRYSPWNPGIRKPDTVSPSEQTAREKLANALNRSARESRNSATDSATTGKRQTDNLRSSVLKQMSAVSAAMQIRGPSSHRLAIEEEVTTEKDSATSAPNVPADADPASSTIHPLIAAGSILYAETLNSVSSLQPSVLAAEIRQGPHAGGRLIGRFTASPRAGGLYLEFDRFIDRNARTHQVEAVAIDGYSSEAALASSVETSLLGRIGPVLAASFLSGFARSAAQTGQTLHQLGETFALTQAIPSLKSSLYAGVGEATGVLVDELRSSGQSAPEIKLNAGHPLGILFLTGVPG